MADNTVRINRLNAYFKQVLHGRAINQVSDFNRFLEAIVLQKSPSETVERLAASPNAMAAIQKAVRSDVSPASINRSTSQLLQYLSDDSVKQLCNGQFLEKILLAIFEPRTLWNALVKAFRARELTDQSISSLAWMTIELLSLRSVDVLADAQALVDEGTLFTCPLIEVRNRGHRIKHLIQMRSSSTAPDPSSFSPGGRHDNDFEDFRRIAILPTSDEFGCTQRPYYLRADEVLLKEGHERVAAHIDNQFRLLREDLLSELREDVQIAQKAKKGRRSALRLTNLYVKTMSTGSDALKKQRPCTIGVGCNLNSWPMKKMARKAREDYLKQNSYFLKHQSIGCLIKGNEVVAFTSIERDRDDSGLLLDNPVIKLQVSGEEQIRKVLIALELHDDVDLITVSTPVFAYHPILKCLQEKLEFPLIQDLFLHEKGGSIETADTVPGDLMLRIAQQVRETANLQSVLKAPKPIVLDSSQAQSLLRALAQAVSLIQGPPGKYNLYT